MMSRQHSSRICLIGLSAAAVASAWGQSFDFFQSSFDLNGTVTSDSEYGLAKVDYTGMSSLEFLNVSWGSSWVIQNMPLMSENGSGLANELYLPFNLGVSRGTSVTSGTFGFSLSTAPTDSAPVSSFAANVAAYNYLINSGGQEYTLGPVTGAGAPTNGAGAAGNQPATHRNFPNQESSKAGCAPTAISNSLQWLKATYNLQNMPDAKITPGALETALGKTDNGVPIFGANAFWRKKDAYLKSFNAPVTTTTSSDWPTILKAMKDGQDVELECQGHTVSLIGITDLGGGKYALDIAHDTQQGMAGGTITERSVFDTATGKFKDGTWINGQGLNYAVIECPVATPEPSSFLALGAGLAGILFRRKHNRSA